MCCQILQGEGHYAMNARISILPDDKCYLLPEGLVNFCKGLALSVSLPKVLAKNINRTVWFCFIWIFFMCLVYTAPR